MLTPLRRLFLLPRNIPLASPYTKFHTSSFLRMQSTINEIYSINRLFNVEGWVAVVTGGGTGIGLMIAQTFANNGARVYIVGRRKDALDSAISSHGGGSLLHPKGQLIPVVADITDKASIRQLVEHIAKQERKIDVLVNNAGISEGTSEVEKGDESVRELMSELWSETMQSWENVYRTNVIGHFFTTVGFLPLLSAAATTGTFSSDAKTSPTRGHTGSVINISSMSGITRTTQHHFKYNVSKAASIHLTSLLAQELRRSSVNIRVNSIAPGIFPSEMTTEGSDEQNKSHIPTDESYGQKKGIPAGRPGADEDMAQAVLSLACNEYAYGQTLVIDGGYLLEHP